MYWGQHWGQWGAGAPPWPFHIFCLIFLGLLIWGVVTRVKRRRRGHSIPPWMASSEPDAFNGADAMEVLRQRYARGEIDTTTFEQMREHLSPSGRS